MLVLTHNPGSYNGHLVRLSPSRAMRRRAISVHLRSTLLFSHSFKSSIDAIGADVNAARPLSHQIPFSHLSAKTASITLLHEADDFPRLQQAIDAYAKLLRPTQKWQRRIRGDRTKATRVHFHHVYSGHPAPSSLICVHPRASAALQCY